MPFPPYLQHFAVFRTLQAYRTTGMNVHLYLCRSRGTLQYPCQPICHLRKAHHSTAHHWYLSISTGYVGPEERETVLFHWKGIWGLTQCVKVTEGKTTEGKLCERKRSAVTAAITGWGIWAVKAADAEIGHQLTEALFITPPKCQYLRQNSSI